MTAERRAVQRLVIVGGGTAGWMAAAYLRRRTGCAITLVESPDIGTIGVGEATIPSLVHFLEGMRLDEEEFLRRCHATYKLAIRFEGWVRPGHAYWHPFGLCGGNIDGLDLFHHWLKSRLVAGNELAYSDYSPQALLCEQGRAHRAAGGEAVVANYAFHLDAGAFAEMLRSIAVAEGVRHVKDDVREVVVDESGRIDRLETAGGKSLEAELFLDATGFRGLLVEEALGDPFVDWSGTLLCDRAAVLGRAPDAAMPPFTRSTATPGGWAWRIPLAHRTGHGHVYSSAHLGEEEAERELRKQAGLDESEDAEVRRLRMRVGRRTEFWKANCVSVGLASGFIEPLESTGIYFVQRALELLVDHFPDRGCDPALRGRYNELMGEHYEDVRDFVLLHYLTSRRDEPFWRDARGVGVPDSLQRAIERHDATGLVVEAGPDACFREVNWHHIHAGGERLPRRWLPRADFSDFGAVQRLLEEIRAKNARLAASLPSHADLMTGIHGPAR